MKRITLILLAFLPFYACNSPRLADTGEVPVPGNLEILYATLYSYFAAEYKALAHQAYNVAGDRLELLAVDGKAGNQAIVLDIDETVLDNSPYQATLIRAGIRYDSCWNEWGDLAGARPVPGSLRFLNKADSLGFHIFYVSNRKEKNLKEGTLRNLQQLGFPQAVEEHLYLRKDSSDKTSRRQAVSKDYEIVMLIGDNLGDFYTDSDIFSEREKLMQEHRKAFGRKFIILPNAMYGNWVNSLDIQNDPAAVDSLLEIMTRKLDGVCP